MEKFIKELENIIIEYTDKDKNYIDELCKSINEMSNEILYFFKLKKLHQKAYVYLYASLEEFHQKYIDFGYLHNRKEVPNYVCGFSRKGCIHTLTLSEYRKTLSHESADIEMLKKLILHEFVHNCEYEINQNNSYMWLREGLATTISHQYDNEELVLDMTLEQAQYGGTSYKNYRTMFLYVLETYGHEYILELINDLEKLKNDTPKLYEEAKLFYLNNDENKKKI